MTTLDLFTGTAIAIPSSTGRSVVTVSPITDGAPFEIKCPHCGLVLIRVESRFFEILTEFFVVTDGDTIPMVDRLTRSQRKGCCTADLNVGCCESCDRPYFQIVTRFMDKQPSEAIEDAYLFRNAKVPDPVNFRATCDGETWLISRYDTPLGPMLQHDLGLFADRYGAWQNENGVASCTTGGPWAFARDYLADRWDDLRDVPTSIGLDPADPRARTRRARKVPKRLGRRVYRPYWLATAPDDVEARLAAAGFRDGGPANEPDDDIPF